jgi:hypothetical protein
MVKKIFNNKNINYFAYFFLISSYLFVFYFSFKTVLHEHSYSQIFISYSEGFIKNALLGSLIFKIQELFNLDFKVIVNIIFLIFHFLNILLFLRILKPLINFNKIIYIFFLLNPALILFPIYDIGAFLRKETFMITSFLFHIYFSQLYNGGLINVKRYSIFFIYFLSPFIIINSLIHSIQILFLPLHFLIFRNNIKNYYEKKNFVLIIVLLLLFFSQFVFYQQIPSDLLFKTTSENLGSFNDQFNFTIDPFLFLNMGIIERFSDTVIYIKDIKFVSLYLISALIIFLPLLFILKKIDTSDQKFKFSYTFISILPFFLLLFLASDWGRWIYIIAMILLGVNLQFKITNISKFNHGNLLNFAILILIGFYLFFYNLSHCCIKNLFFYGMNQNIQLLINLVLDNVKIIEHIKY